MNLVFIIVVMAMASPLGLARSDFRRARGQKARETTDALSRPEPAEETDDTEGAFQSDILFTPEQLEEVMQEIKQEGGLSKRKAVSSLTNRWPQNTVMYEFDPSSEANRDDVLAGMAMWTENSCVRFVPYTDEMATTLGHHNRVQFYKGSGCSSYIGMVGNGVQRLSVGKGCTSAGTIAHELGHALGWHHEQSRPDRDSKVTVNYDNVAKGKEINFVKYSDAKIVTFDVPYDVGSIMHYGSGYFSANGEPTIIAQDPLDQLLMGNRAEFSFYDKKLANAMFECNEKCSSDLQCQNEGFVGESCTCVCKPGYSGTNCETFDPDSLGCIRTLTDQTGTLTSPGYPAQYQNGQSCIWKIEGGAGATISLSFTAFDVEGDEYGCYDQVTIRYDDDLISGGQKYCGNTLPPDIVSTGNQILVIFSSDGFMPAGGFEANYVIHGNTVIPTTLNPLATTVKPDICETVEGTCGGVFGEMGCLASPNYGQGTYGGNEDCIYNIEVAEGERVELSLMDLDIEYQKDCAWDRLEIELGEGVVGIMKLCGNNRPSGSFVSLSNTMKLRLISDASVNKQGFSAKFQAVSMSNRWLKLK